MIRRLGAFGSAGALLASALMAVVTMAASAAYAETFEDWANVSAGRNHSCGVRENGKLYCWGSDNDGQLGDGILHTDGSTAPRRIGSFEDWANVDAGRAQTCGVRKNGKLYCWGSDDEGQVGDGGDNAQAISSPRRIGTFEDWASVTAGGSHTCGVRKNGKLYCWGDDRCGQVGDGGSGVTCFTDQDEPEPVPSPVRVGTFEDWANVSAGTDYTCGVRKNGKLYCWGSDACGQAGAGGTAEYCGAVLGEGSGEGSAFAAPHRIGTFEDWTTVSAGGTHTCGVRHGGKLYCWGQDGHGRVGDGGTNEFSITAPRRIGTFEDWATITAGGLHTCGVRKNGKLYCWGYDSKGQVGDGNNPDPAVTPRRIGTLEDWASSSAGDLHTCGIRSGGRLYCWGDDGYGQVGNGNSLALTNVPRPV